MAPPTPEIIEMIRKKKMQYARFVDTSQLSRMPEVALPDAKFSFFHADMVPMRVGKQLVAFDSLAKYQAFLGKSAANSQKLHVVGPGEMEQASPDTVTAMFCVRDEFKLKGALGLVWTNGGGHYHETWRHKDGDWFIQELRMERTYTTSSILFILLNLLIDVLTYFGVQAY